MTTAWEDAWEVAEANFRALAETLTLTYPSLTWTCGHSENESFAFRAFASFAVRDAPRVVLSVDFQRMHGAVVYTSDVALEDGQVLADGPSGTVGLPGDGTPEQDRFRALLEEIAAFIVGSSRLVGDQFKAV